MCQLRLIKVLILIIDIIILYVLFLVSMLGYNCFDLEGRVIFGDSNFIMSMRCCQEVVYQYMVKNLVILSEKFWF